MVYAEYPRVRAFALAPGIVRTRLSIEAGVGGEFLNDTAALPAATTLYLTSGRADWLSGRSVDRAWLCKAGYEARCSLTRRQVLLLKLGHRRGGTGLEGRDPRAESARKQVGYSQTLSGKGYLVPDAAVLQVALFLVV